jgi:ribonuclease HI
MKRSVLSYFVSDAVVTNTPPAHKPSAPTPPPKEQSAPPRNNTITFFLNAGAPPADPMSKAPQHQQQQQQEPQALPPPTRTMAATPSRRYIDIFCDGGCLHNGRAFSRAGFGVHVLMDGELHTEVSVPLSKDELQTNQRAELRALERALKYTQYSPEEYHVRIFTDSEYSINCITKWAAGWKRNDWRKSVNHGPVKNRDIIEPVYEMWETVKYRTTIEHVKAHTGRTDWKSEGNRRADELATAAMHYPAC